VWKRSLHPLDDAPVTPHSLAHLTYHPTAIPEILTSSRSLKRWQANDSPLNHNRSRCQDAAHRVPGKPLAGRLVEAAAISRYPQIPFGGHPCMLMIIRQTVEPKHCQTHRSRVVDRLVRGLLALAALRHLVVGIPVRRNSSALPTSTRCPFLPPSPDSIISHPQHGHHC
jgi:hypothetical protein